MTNNPLIAYRSPLTKGLNDAATAALAPLEAALTRRAAGDPSRVCFILGAPRGGTTLLYELLVTRYRCAYFSNFAKRLHRAPVAATWLVRKEMAARRGSFDSVYGDLPGKAAPSEAGRIWIRWMPDAAPYHLDRPALSPEVMRAKMAAMSRIAGGPMIVKNLILQSDLPRLLESFPDAIFLHVERDLADNARSLVRARADKSPDDPSRWWSLRPRGSDPFEREDPAVQSCAQVLLSHRELDRELAAHGREDRRLRVSYERLCREPATVLAEVEAHFRAHGMPLSLKPDAPEPPAIERRAQPDDEMRARILAALEEVSARLAQAEAPR